jgi:hypothetical protein
MRKLISIIIVVTLFASCAPKLIPKATAYKGVYDEKPLTILLMPPINRSTNVEAKEFFHSTLCIPLTNQGYYVIPTFLSMEILKKESAYDSEMFLNSPLQKFGEVFGADVALFTIIHRWDKSGLAGSVKVEIEYILKSTKTNEVLYTRKGLINYDTSIRSNSGSLAGLLVSVAATAINTAATKYVDVAMTCNKYTLTDMPVGKYSPKCQLDKEEMAGLKEFKVTLNSQYR